LDSEHKSLLAGANVVPQSKNRDYNTHSSGPRAAGLRSCCSSVLLQVSSDISSGLPLAFWNDADGHRPGAQRSARVTECGPVDSDHIKRYRCPAPLRDATPIQAARLAHPEFDPLATTAGQVSRPGGVRSAECGAAVEVTRPGGGALESESSGNRKIF
jgi:hypothetical protein